VFEKNVQRQNINRHHIAPDFFIFKAGRAVHGGDMKSSIRLPPMQQRSDGVEIAEIDLFICEASRWSNIAIRLAAPAANHLMAAIEKCFRKVASILPIDA